MARDPVDQAADAIAESAPAPQEAAIQSSEPQSTSKDPQFAGFRDRNGRGFDSDLHIVGPDGKPELTKKGLLKIRPGVKGPEARSKLAVPERAAMDAQRTRAVAVATVGAIETTAVLAFGEDWRYQRDESIGVDERAHGVEVWTQLFEEYGVRDVPPWLALSIWGAGYALPRLMQSKTTKTRLSRLVAWGKAKVTRKRDRHAHVDRRDDRVRQDDVGDSARAPLS